MAATVSSRAAAVAFVGVAAAVLVNAYARRRRSRRRSVKLPSPGDTDLASKPAVDDIKKLHAEHLPPVEAGEVLSAAISELKVLAVGTACIDNVVQVEEYPEEDSEQRCTAYRTVRGGNATNTLKVCAQLGVKPMWIGTIPDDSREDTRFLLKTLQQERIDFSGRVSCMDTAVPVSWVTVSSHKLSRTILHYRNLPELTYKQFVHSFTNGDDTDAAIARRLATLRWIHVEGRNIEETRKIMTRLRKVRQTMTQSDGWTCIPTISLEVERPRPKLAESLVGLADVIFVAKEYATHYGHTSSASVIRSLMPLARSRALIVSAWGEAGASAVDLQELNNSRLGEPRMLVSHAFSPDTPVDTLGAGDTFHAGMICGLIDGLRPEGALMFACAVAGLKVGQMGMDNVVVRNRDALRRIVDKARLV